MRSVFDYNGLGRELSPFLLLDYAAPHVAAKSDAQLLVMDGAPIDEPIVGHGPFVMNTRTEIDEAFADFERGRIGGLSS